MPSDSILISVSDVQSYREISDNFNTNRFNALAREVQRINLRKLLGPELYYDFFLNITAQKYVDLRDGKVYSDGSNTIEYFGLKPYIAYHWLALAIRESDIFISDYGSLEFAQNPNDYMMKADKQNIDKVASRYLESAIDYGNDIIKFISDNNSDYPLWNTQEKIKPITGYNFFHS